MATYHHDCSELFQRGLRKVGTNTKKLLTAEENYLFFPPDLPLMKSKFIDYFSSASW